MFEIGDKVVVVGKIKYKPTVFVVQDVYKGMIKIHQHNHLRRFMYWVPIEEYRLAEIEELI